MPERTRLSRVPWWGWTGGAIAAVIAGVVLFLALFDWNQARGFVGREASRLSGRPVRIDGDLKVHLFSWTPSASVGRLWVGNPAWMNGGALAKVGTLAVSVRLLPLLTGQVELPLLQLQDADISLYRDASDRANWRRNASNAAPFKLPPIQRFLIENSHVHLVDQRRRIVLDGAIESHETHVGQGARQGGVFSLEGRGTINREPFLLHVTGGALLNVRRDRPYHFDADLRAGQTHVIARGVLSRPFDFGQVDTAINVSGADFADLYDLTGLAFPKTPPYSLTGRLVRDERRYRFTGVTGRVGQSDLEGAFLADDTTGRPDLHADLHSRNLNVRDLGSVVGAPPRGARTPAEQADAARLAGQGRFLPDATLDVARVRSMDATVRYAADSVTAPNNLPLRKVRLTLILDHGLLRFDPVSFIMPHGELTGRVSINARGAIPHDAIDLKVLNLRLEDIFPSKNGKPSLEGGLEARAVLSGDGASIHAAAADANGTVSLVTPRGEIRQAFAELLGINVANGLGLLLTNSQQETGLRCAVADFRAQRGVLHTQTLVVDTDVVRATGQGDIDLGSEALNLTLKGKPKKFRILHLNAPVAVTGHLRSPKFGLKPGKGPLQVAGAVALGALLSPVAAILPFIDAGLTHDADCVSLVAGAEQAGAPVKPSATTTTPSKRN